MLIDSTSDDFRSTLIDYAINRTAPNDILILYFSGHGALIGNSDFGFCTKDTCFHLEYNLIPPLSLVRFSDIVETLAYVKVDPVIIIDACFSGQVGKKMDLILSQMKRIIQAETGSTYALLCSSQKIEESITMSTGGTFSRIFNAIAANGLGDVHKRKNILSLEDMYKSIRNKFESEYIDFKPQLFIGKTLPEFGLVKNVKYSPLEMKFSKGFAKILLEFWNNGNPRELTTEQLQPIGSTVHTTYSKLQHYPWALIMKPARGVGRLTKRGIDFIQNKIAIPYSIYKNDNNDEWEATPGTRMISFNEYV
jgi:hypothetical protein